MTKRQKELLRILEDKHHGSSDILKNLNQHLLKYSSDSDYIKFVVNRKKKIFPQFSLIQNYLNDLYNVLDKSNNVFLKDFLNGFDNFELKRYQNIFNKLQKNIPNAITFLTISHSKTVIEILKLWKLYKNNLKVIVCESRPGLEGRILAKELLNQGIKVEIVTEAMMALKVLEVDTVLLGADQILMNRNIVNKTGSKVLAIAAMYHKVPVYVLASKQKAIKENIFKSKSDDPEQIWKYKHKNLRVSNNLFEEVENGLITKIITD